MDKPELVNKETSRFCLGLPFNGTRAINREELERHAGQLKAIELRMKRQTWFLGAFAAVAFLAGIDYAFQNYSPAVGNAGLVLFFSGVAIALGIAGIAGSFAEVIFGAYLFSRIFFGAALAASVVAFSFNGPWTEIVGPVSAIAVLIGGNAVLARQVLQRRRTRRLARDLRDDLFEGIAWRFERDFQTGVAESPVERHTAEVLPRSSIAVAVDNEALRYPTILNVTEVMAGGTGAIDAPLTSFEPRHANEHLNFRQRHLTGDEKNELAALMRRDLRRVLMYGALLFWAAMGFARGLETLVTKNPTGLTSRSLILASVLVIGFLGKQLIAWRRVRADLHGGIVVVLRPKEAADEVLLEQLPRSNMVWSEFGAPSLWRARQRTSARG